MSTALLLVARKRKTVLMSPKPNRRRGLVPTEEMLRDRVLDDPFDPEPIAELGFRRLTKGAVLEAEFYFRDALRLDVRHEPARLGQALVAVVLVGGSAALIDLDFDRIVRRLQLPERKRDALRRFVCGQAELTGGGGKTHGPEIFRELGARNVTSRERLRELCGDAPRPFPGREDLSERVLQALDGMAERAVVLAGETRIDLAIVYDALVTQLASRQGARSSGGAVWEISGALAPKFEEIGWSRALRALREVRRSGHVLMHHDLAEAIQSMRGERVRAVLETGSLVALVSGEILDRMLAAAPNLKGRFTEIRVAPMRWKESRDALCESRGEMSRWLRVRLSREVVEQSVTLAEHYLFQRALPEAAVALMERGRQFVRGHGGTAMLSRRALMMAAAEMARLRVERVRGPMVDDANRLAVVLHEATGSHRQVSETVAKVIASRCAVGGLRAEGDGPDAAFLFIGPGGVGKQTMARAIADVLFGKDHFLGLDLASAGFDPEALVGRAGGEIGVLGGFLSRQPFSVVFLDNADQASPPVLSALASLLETGRLPGETSGPPLRRAIVILAVNATVEPMTVGFLRKGKHGEAVATALRERFFATTPSLLRRLVVVCFDSLKEPEFAELIRRRVEEVALGQIEAERGIVIDCDSRALDVAARRVRASGLHGERLHELIDQMILRPLWPLLGSGGTHLKLVESAGELLWVQGGGAAGGETR